MEKLDQWRRFSDEVKRQAVGRWDYVLEAAEPSLGPALKAVGRHVPCPSTSHTNSRDGFRLFRDVADRGGGCCNTCGFFPDGFDLLGWLTGRDFRDLVIEVGHLVGVRLEDYIDGYARQSAPAKVVPIRPPVVAEDPAPVQVRIDTLLGRHMRTWKRSLPGTDPRAHPIWRYLAGRGLAADPSGLPRTLRFIPRAGYYEADDAGKPVLASKWPAMLAPVQGPDGTLLSLHRTFLTPEGQKAPVDKVKRLAMVGQRSMLSGAAIRLAPVGAVLGVTEGIENALGILQHTSLPTWATANATLMESFVIPSSVKLLLIWSDKDRSGRGEEAAQVLAKRARAQGVLAPIMTPDREIPEDAKGVDWLEVVTGGGSPKLEEASAIVYDFLRRAG